MDNNLSRILYEVQNNIQWGAGIYGTPPYNFEAFTHSQESAYDLAINFLKYYERPASLNYSRGTQAEYWFNFLDDDIPPGVYVARVLPFIRQIVTVTAPFGEYPSRWST